eukprot:TRINITY_DN67904_c5_g2_i2.p1 TRINITY_DN67904_c5_g2~~TRINITY_DN67904_c5_g2_i2.p1  ORF type:complete len:265 (-),score=27.98 TRINITY_DN67904_c5_g2_i2:43-837(-)
MSVIDIEDAHSLRVNFDQDTPLRKGTKMVTRQNWSLQAVKKYQPRAHAAHLIIPTDAMLIMLSFLPARLVMESVQLVSKQWFCTAMDNTLWRELFRFGISKLTGPEGQVHVNHISDNFSGRHFFLLYKRYIAIKNTSDEVMQLPHIRWLFRCPLSWWDLQPTKDFKERTCTACNTAVKHYSSYEVFCESQPLSTLTKSGFSDSTQPPSTATQSASFLVSDQEDVGTTYLDLSRGIPAPPLPVFGGVEDFSNMSNKKNKRKCNIM